MKLYNDIACRLRFFLCLVCLFADQTGVRYFAAERGSKSCERLAVGDLGAAVEIARVWTGAATDIGGATDAKGRLFSAFYGPDRFLTVARFDADKREVCIRKLPSRFDGWDGHNSIALAIGRDGTLHVAGNMHSSPIVYASGHVDDLSSLHLKGMIGREENAVTYPKFMFAEDGTLMFLYRDGSSGSGRWIVNKLIERSWVRISELFANQDQNGQVSAYPTDFVRSADGRYHVAVVWRRTWDVSTNFKVTYASTSDFVSWFVNGKRRIGPLAPETMESVDNSGSGQGLVNNAKIILTNVGEPIVLFTKYGLDGRNAVLLSKRDAGAWNSQVISTSKGRKEILGGGTLAGLPIIKAKTAPNGYVRIHIVYDTETQNFLISPKNWESYPQKAEVDPLSNYAKGLADQAEGMVDVIVPQHEVRQNGVDGPIRGTLRWFVQKANQDKARECTPLFPAACKPFPSPLLWFSRNVDEPEM